MHFLERVMAEKFDEVAARRRRRAESSFEVHPSVGDGVFLASLLEAPPRLICEVKRKSPTRPALAPDDDVLARVDAYHEGGAAAISVLTDGPHFGGSLDDLKRIRERVPTPLLRKDFLVDPYQVYEALDAGANSVLLIVAGLEQARFVDLMACARESRIEPLVEIHDEAELDRAMDAEAKIIGVNNRDLKSLEVTLDTSRRILPRIPPEVVAIAESGIRTRDEIAELTERGARGFLIGSSLMTSGDLAGTLKALQEPAAS